MWFTWSTIVSAAVWVPVMRLAAPQRAACEPADAVRRRGRVHAVPGLLDLPFRAFSQNELETATWEGKHCYVLGERENDLLLFCPELAPPRSVPVPKDAAGLRRLGVKENVFERIRSTP